MSVFVDTSVWSLALRRDPPPLGPEVQYLNEILRRGEVVLTTGLILQEILQGIQGPKSREKIIAAFMELPFLIPEKQDHIEAAVLRNHCRRNGIQIGTIDALLAQLCIHHELDLLTRDGDFKIIAGLSKLKVLGYE